MDAGYYIKRTNGEPWQWNVWQPGMAVVDFTNPAATEWYLSKLRNLLDIGVDCFKTDFAERIPHLDVVFHDKSVDPVRMHNYYSVLYNEKVFGLLEEVKGKGEAVLFARSAHAGGQRFPVVSVFCKWRCLCSPDAQHWGGDCESTFEAMAEATRGLLSLSLSGFGYGAHDIGGFEGLPPAELYMRWVAFGMFTSHTRLHGSTSYRVPWLYGEAAAVAMSKLQDLKHRLMPYIFSYAIAAHTVGHPMHRPLFLEFPEDRTTHHLDRQYLLGSSLLVAPAYVAEKEEHEYYLPAGRWTELTTGRTLAGPRWVCETVALDSIPVWVRAGSLLALGPSGIGRPDYALAEGVEVRVYELEDGATTQLEVPSGQGAELAGTIVASRKGDTIFVEAQGSVSFGTIGVFIDGYQITDGAEKQDGFLRVSVGAAKVEVKLAHV